MTHQFFIKTFKILYTIFQWLLSTLC